MKVPTISHTYTDENGRLVAVLEGQWSSEKEIEEASRAHMELLCSRIKPDGWTASEKRIFHKSPTFMDYLHGDVKVEEAEFACRYEYARESKDVWDAAKLRDNAKEKLNLNCEQAYWSVHYEFEDWIQVTYWLTDFFLCESFPHKDWNALNDAEKKKILFLHETRKVPPLSLQILHYVHYPKEEFPEFNELAAQTEPIVKNVRPGEIQEPVKVTKAMTQKFGSIYYCLFVVDFSESPKLLSQRFVAWLNQSKIESLWLKHKKQRAGAIVNSLRTGKVVRWKGMRGAYWSSFEVDLSASKGDLTEQFKKWLALPENKERLKQYKQEKRGTSDNWKDRLKDLAVWRLYRENENSCDKANKFAHDNRKRFATRLEIYAAGKTANGKRFYKFNDPRPFRDAKAIKGIHRIAANEAELFSHDEDYRHAKCNALKLLIDWIPREFEKPFPEMRKAFDELEKIASKN
jgi:hypothetical protein